MVIAIQLSGGRPHIVAMQGLDAVEAVELDQQRVRVGQDVSVILRQQRLEHLDFILPPRHTPNNISPS